MEAFLRRRVEEKEREVARLRCDLERREQRIENLSQALARARADNACAPDNSPYAKYRQIVVPRRRWWFF
jgi:predicted RNase H-like nuclease (RuvC/YqgF family)